MTIDTISALGTEKIEQPYLLGVFGVTEALFSVVVTFSQVCFNDHHPFQ